MDFFREVAPGQSFAAVYLKMVWPITDLTFGRWNSLLSFRALPFECSIIFLINLLITTILPGFQDFFKTYENDICSWLKNYSKPLKNTIIIIINSDIKIWMLNNLLWASIYYNLKKIHYFTHYCQNNYVSLREHYKKRVWNKNQKRDRSNRLKYVFYDNIKFMVTLSHHNILLVENNCFQIN